MLEAPPKVLRRLGTLAWADVFWIVVWSQLGQHLPGQHIWPYLVMLAPMTLVGLPVLYGRPRLYSLADDLPWVIWYQDGGRVVVVGSARTERLARWGADDGRMLTRVEHYSRREDFEAIRLEALERWLDEPDERNMP